MEVKDFNAVAQNLVKANELIAEVDAAKNKEVEDVTGDVMQKMGRWFLETCKCGVDMKTKNRKVWVTYIKLENFKGNIELIFRAGGNNGNVTIDIREIERFKTGIGSSGFNYTIFGKNNLNYGNGKFCKSSYDGSYWHDEQTLAAIASVWKYIKTYIESWMREYLEIAKNESIQKMADIKRSMEIAESLKDFEV